MKAMQRGQHSWEEIPTGLAGASHAASRDLRGKSMRYRSDEWRDFHNTVSAWETERCITMF